MKTPSESLPENGRFVILPKFVPLCDGYKPRYGEVIRALVQLAGPAGECAATREELIVESGMGLGTVSQAIRWAAAAGIIEVIPDRRVVAGRRLRLLWRRSKAGIVRVAPSASAAIAIQTELPFTDASVPAAPDASAPSLSERAPGCEGARARVRGGARQGERGRAPQCAPPTIEDAPASDSVDSVDKADTVPSSTVRGAESGSGRDETAALPNPDPDSIPRPSPGPASPAYVDPGAARLLALAGGEIGADPDPDPGPHPWLLSAEALAETERQLAALPRHNPTRRLFAVALENHRAALAGAPRPAEPPRRQPTPLDAQGVPTKVCRDERFALEPTLEALGGLDALRADPARFEAAIGWILPRLAGRWRETDASFLDFWANSLRRLEGPVLAALAKRAESGKSPKKCFSGALRDVFAERRRAAS